MKGGREVRPAQHIDNMAACNILLYNRSLGSQGQLLLMSNFNTLLALQVACIQ
jgi:hypothetical protein